MKFECLCNYCLNNTFIWELEDGRIWIEIPKNASYNLKQMKFNYDSRFPIEQQPNSKIKKIEKINSLNNKNGFVIFRDPIDRFKSLISHYFLSGSRQRIGTKWLEDKLIFNFNKKNIVDIVLNNWNDIKNISEPHHFNSQSSFIPKEFFEINYTFYDLKDSTTIFGIEKNINSSGSFNLDLSVYQIDIIKNIYADDFEIYNKYLN